MLYGHKSIRKYVNEICPNCGEKSLYPKGSFKIKEEPFVRQRYKCDNCKKSTSLTRKKYKGRCQLCGGKHVRYAGHYRTKSKPKVRRRHYCYDCKRNFPAKRINYKSRLDIGILKEIKRLANEKKLVPNKYSLWRKKNLQKALLYTDSDLVKIIKKKFRRRVSRNNVAKLIKKFRKSESLYND